MQPSLTFLLIFPSAIIAIFHIDHLIVESNKKYNNLTLDYSHDVTGNAIVNETLENFFVATKLLVYVKVNVADDVHDDLFKREFLRTQIDFNKLYDEIYGNILIKGFMDKFMQELKAQNFSIPLKAV